MFDQSQILLGPNAVTGEELTKAAVRGLRQARGRKFFLWVHYYDPHTDYVRHAEYGYADAYSGLLPTSIGFGYLDHIKTRLGGEDLGYVKDVYDEEITFTDRVIGQLLLALQELGLADHTIIVLTADHGEEFLDHDKIGHGETIYQEVIHVPLVIAGVKMPAGSVVNQPVELRSVGRTILDLCGAGKTFFPGINLLAPTQKYGQKSEGLVFSESNPAMRNWNQGVLGFGWKLIRNLDDSYELYNLEQDPQEKRNIFEKQQQIGALLARELRTFRARTQTAAKPVDLKEKELKLLRSLGYIR